jgi:hypothetical protein
MQPRQRQATVTFRTHALTQVDVVASSTDHVASSTDLTKSTLTARERGPNYSEPRVFRLLPLQLDAAGVSWLAPNGSAAARDAGVGTVVVC